MIEAVMGVIGTILYPLFSIIFLFIDILQAIYFAFAGIDDVVYNGVYIGSGNTGDVNDNGLVFYLLNSDLVKNVFYSIMLLAFVLIIIFTVMAFLKNVYAEQPKSWKAILGSTIKGLANFFLVPVFCLLGVWLGNILLVAINGATSATNTMNLSRQLFITSAYNANKIRSGDMYGDTITEEAATEIQAFCAQYGVSVDLPSDPNGSTDLEYYAGKIDEVFALSNGPSIAGFYGMHNDVPKYYSQANINYILLVGGGIFILYILVNISFMMVKRIFMLLILFIISPAVCSMYPLDDGQKVKSWKDSFIKQFLNAFSAVAAMNLFFCVSPLIQNISIPGVVDVLGVIPLLLTIAGLYVVKDLITLINSFIGGDNPFDTGLASAVKGRISSVRKGAQKAASVAGGAFGAGVGAYRNVRDRGSSKVGAFFKGALGGTVGNLGKQLNDAWGLGLKKAAGSAYGKSRKDWDPKYDDRTGAEKRRDNLIKEAEMMKKSKQMAGHENDTDVKKAKALYGEDIVNTATEDTIRNLNAEGLYTPLKADASDEEKAERRLMVSNAEGIIRGYAKTKGGDVQADFDKVGDIGKKFDDFNAKMAELQGLTKKKDDKGNLTDIFSTKDQDRYLHGVKYTSEQIGKAKTQDERDAMYRVNSAIDKKAEVEALKSGLESVFKDLAGSTNNDTLAAAIQDQLAPVMEELSTAISSSDASTLNTSTQIVNLLTNIKESTNKSANAQLSTADGIKKVAANTAANKKDKK